MEYNTIAVNKIEHDIAALIMPIMDNSGYEVVRIRMHATTHTPKIQIMMQKPDGTCGIEDCSAASRIINAQLEVHDILDGAYTLEVSSPGIDRPLTRQKDFTDWQGYTISLATNQLIDNCKNFKGTLVGFENNEVLLDIDEGTIGIPINWVARANLIYDTTTVFSKDSIHTPKPAGHT